MAIVISFQYLPIVLEQSKIELVTEVVQLITPIKENKSQTAQCGGRTVIKPIHLSMDSCQAEVTQY